MAANDNNDKTFSRADFQWKCYLCNNDDAWKLITEGESKGIRCRSSGHANSAYLQAKGQKVTIKCILCGQTFDKPGNTTDWQALCTEHSATCMKVKSAPSTPLNSSTSSVSSGGAQTAPAKMNRVVRAEQNTPTKHFSTPLPSAIDQTNYSAPITLPQEQTGQQQSFKTTDNSHSLSAMLSAEIASESVVESELKTNDNTQGQSQSSDIHASTSTQAPEPENIGWVYVIKIPVRIIIHDGSVPQPCLLKIGKSGDKELKKLNCASYWNCLLNRLGYIKTGWKNMDTEVDIPDSKTEDLEPANFQHLGCLLKCTTNGAQLADRERFLRSSLGVAFPKEVLQAFFAAKQVASKAAGLGLTEYVLTTEHAFYSLQNLYRDIGPKLSLNLINQTFKDTYEYFPRVHMRFQFGSLIQDVWLALRVSKEAQKDFKLRYLAQIHLLSSELARTHLKSEPIIKTEK